MRDAALVVAAVLKMVNTVMVNESVTLMGVALKNEVDVAVGEGGVVIRRNLRSGDV